MSQQINLLGPVLRTTAFSFTSATAMLCAVGIAAALTSVAAFYESSRLRAVEAEARAVAQKAAEVRAKYEAAGGPVPRKPDPALESGVTELAAEFKAREDVLDALKGGTVGTTAGFSSYLRAFSRQRVEGVWLTGFDISAGGADLTIAGRTLSADLVPAYLQRLNGEPPMQGRQFASVVINQPGAREGAKGPADPKEAPARAALPPYLDFTISSGDLGARETRTAEARSADAAPPGSRIIPPSVGLRTPLEPEPSPAPPPPSR